MNRLMMGVGILLCVPMATTGKEPESPEPGAAAALVQGNNQFACDLYARLGASTQGNVFFAPYSLSTALALAHAGAGGETAEQMTKALHLSQDANALHAGFAALQREMVGTNKPRAVQFQTANALWGQKDYGFQPVFLSTLKEHYGATLHEVDFHQAAGEARKAINDNVEKLTQGKIRDLMPDGVLTNQTRLVLTNAIYFKGTWATPFAKGKTRDDPFSVSKDKKVKAAFMRLTCPVAYFEDSLLQAIELPYTGGDLGLVVLLPRKLDGLTEVDRALSAGHLADWSARLKTRKIDVHLPRFQLTGEFELKDALAGLGMTLPFNEARADFSRMTENEAPLCLAAVVHRAFVEINEEGTEAAAATAVIAKPRSLANLGQPVFRADHPFVFLIRDRRSGNILMIGRLCNP